MRLRWTDQARDEVLRAFLYIAAERPKAARALMYRIRDSLRTACEHPLMGRTVPELEVANIRERIVPPYRLIYQVRRDELVVLSMLHERRELPDLAVESE